MAKDIGALIGTLSRTRLTVAVFSGSSSYDDSIDDERTGTGFLGAMLIASEMMETYDYMHRGSVEIRPEGADRNSDDEAVAIFTKSGEYGHWVVSKLPRP